MENDACEFCQHLKDYPSISVGKSGWLESSSNSSSTSKTKNMGGNSKEIINISSSNPSIYVDNTFFASFKKHTKGIGMKLLVWMGYEGGGLRINGQGITNPIEVKKQPRYEQLGYGHGEFGECSKLVDAKKSRDDDMSRQYGSDNGNLSPNRD